MSIALEWKKTKRTGFFLTFVAGGLLAGAVPILNMMVREKCYVGRKEPAVDIILNANWQLMAMLTILLLLVGACMLYHTEYADNAIQRMRTMPKRECGLFYSKCGLLLFMSIFLVFLQALAIYFCMVHWFAYTAEQISVLIYNFSYTFILLLPSVFGFLLIASVCNNMWIPLGIGVVCIFTATMLPTNNRWLSLFPFALPFQTYVGKDWNTIRMDLLAAVVESMLACIAEGIILKGRRALA
ncbi:ABC transporter permease [Anaerosporobacter faecicola]|uniref:ABC transporter permease n=1 Tax=Anaerosporobacter faecicola TaxID=2718714 RepID=UPI00143B7876|nr:ABC transporter permease [Anaerosporobacter faecicola]